MAPERNTVLEEIGKVPSLLVDAVASLIDTLVREDKPHPSGADLQFRRERKVPHDNAIGFFAAPRRCAEFIDCKFSHGACAALMSPFVTNPSWIASVIAS